MHIEIIGAYNPSYKMQMASVVVGSHLFQHQLDFRQRTVVYRRATSSHNSRNAMPGIVIFH